MRENSLRMALARLRRRAARLRRMKAVCSQAGPPTGTEVLEVRYGGCGARENGLRRENLLPPGDPVPLAHLLPGRELVNDEGRCYLISSPGEEVRGALSKEESALALLLSDQNRLGRIFPRWRPGGGGPERFCFFDIETTGLATGCYIFLAGVMTLQESGLELEQILARDYSEEGAVLFELEVRFGRHPLVLCYNGKCFDLPFIEARRSVHGLAPLAGVTPLDLLPPARGAFRELLPDCRLATVEAHLRGRAREDVPSALVPELYHLFVDKGDARLIEKVVHHNRLDLLAMALLLIHLAGLGSG